MQVLEAEACFRWLFTVSFLIQLFETLKFDDQSLQSSLIHKGEFQQGESGKRYTFLKFWLIGLILISFVFMVQPFCWIPGFFLVEIVRRTVWHQGPQNGASDMLTFHSALVALGINFDPKNVELTKVGLLYLGSLVSVSYFVSAWYKIKRSSWRNGQELRLLFESSRFRYLNWRNKKWPESSFFWISISVGVLVFEIIFPLAFMLGLRMQEWVVLGIIFHFLNFIIFGLNRFFWTWVAIYPVFFIK